MASRKSAGQKLRADLDTALAAAGKASGRALEWSEVELDMIGRAADAATTAERVRVLRDAEIAGPGCPSAVVRLSSEVRQLDKQVVELVGRLTFDPAETAKSPRHQRAALARWSRVEPSA